MNENQLTKLNYESLRFIISHGKIQNFFSLQSIQTLRNSIFIHYMFDVSFSFFPQLSFHCINQRKLSSLTNHQSSEYLLQQLEKSKRKRIKLTRRTNRRTNFEGERNWLNINKSSRFPRSPQRNDSRHRERVGWIHIRSWRPFPFV